jgi:hypothetical protein
MSLDNIQLPPLAIEGLFKKTLIELKDKTISKPAKIVSAFNLLGKNKKGVIILVNNADAAFLPEEELNFLIGILSACKLTMEDAGILNIAKCPDLSYHSFEKEITGDKIFLFGVSPEAIKLPLSFPHYQIQAYNSATYLSAPTLALLMQQKEEKLKLWNCLKQIFSI